MRFSRVIRMSFLVLFIGVGLWCGMVLPSLFSQESGNPVAQNPIVPPAGIPGASGAPGGGGLPNTGGIAGGGLGSFGADGSGSEALLDPSLGSGGPGGAPGTISYGGGAPAMMGAPGGMMAPGGMGMGSMMMGSASGPQAEEIRMARTAKSLLNAYAREPKPEVKEKIKSSLRSVLHQQFRLQHQRRDSELARVERRLADLRSRLKKRADAQSTIVDRRLEQLVNDVDGLGWSAEEIPDNLFNDGMSGSMAPGMGGMGGMGGGMSGMGFGGRIGNTSSGTGSAGFDLGVDNLGDSVPAEPGLGSAPGTGSAAPEAGNPQVFPPPPGAGGPGTPSVPNDLPGLPGTAPSGAVPPPTAPAGAPGVAPSTAPAGAGAVPPAGGAPSVVPQGTT